MEEIKIDSETANIILQMYQKINSIKRLLNNEPYSKFMESGKLLSEMMNKTIEETSKQGLKSKLISLSVNLNKFSSNAVALQSIKHKNEITNLFEQLKADISQLHSKINEQ